MASKKKKEADPKHIKTQYERYDMCLIIFCIQLCTYHKHFIDMMGGSLIMIYKTLLHTSNTMIQHQHNTTQLIHSLSCRALTQRAMRSPLLCSWCVLLLCSCIRVPLHSLVHPPHMKMIIPMDVMYYHNFVFALKYLQMGNWLMSGKNAIKLNVHQGPGIHHMRHETSHMTYDASQQQHTNDTTKRMNINMNICTFHSNTQPYICDHALSPLVCVSPYCFIPLL